MAQVAMVCWSGRPVRSSGGYVFHLKLLADPINFIAQPTLQSVYRTDTTPSTAPPRHVDLRLC